MECIKSLEFKGEVRWCDWKGQPIDSVSPGPSPLLVSRTETIADPSMAILRDPKYFVPGGLQKCSEMWKNVPDAPLDVLSFVVDGVNAWDFLVPFKGNFGSFQYDSPSPPRMSFPNSRSCDQFESFIDDTIMERVRNGSLRFWGEVNEVDPPYLVMPITIEPSKPRMCHDERFLNLWVKDLPFTLDYLSDLPRYVERGHFQTVCDDKSGYDHIALTEGSQTLFGLLWKECYFVYRTLPFGWKASAFIYQSVGLIATNHIRSLGVPCSQYIDDRHFGQLITSSTCRWSDFQKSEAATYIAVSILTSLGYTLALAKSSLAPLQEVRYLGYISDSVKCAFVLPDDKKLKFRTLREEILSKDSIALECLQKFAGKTTSFSIAVPAARLYTRACYRAIGAAAKFPRRPVKVLGDLRREIEYWRFLDSWTGYLPWFDERHRVVSSYTDASNSGWGAKLSLEPGKSLLMRDYWCLGDKGKPIAVREALALLYTLKAAGDELRNSRVDCFVDNVALAQSWKRQGGKSKNISDVIIEIYEVALKYNLVLNLAYVPSGENVADAPSRVLSSNDAMLSTKAWEKLESRWGPHSFDLMALDSNVQRNVNGAPLPHFTPWPTQNSSGINVFSQEIDSRENIYVFPPLALVGPLLRFLSVAKAPQVTFVTLDVRPRRYWWAKLVRRCKDSVRLGKKGALSVLSFPSANGEFTYRPLTWDLWAFRLWN